MNKTFYSDSVDKHRFVYFYSFFNKLYYQKSFFTQVTILNDLVVYFFTKFYILISFYSKYLVSLFQKVTPKNTFTNQKSSIFIRSKDTYALCCFRPKLKERIVAIEASKCAVNNHISCGINFSLNNVNNTLDKNLNLYFFYGYKERRLKEFSIGKSLGKGAYGTVYRAYDLVNKDQVAIKLFKPGKATLNEMIQHETEILALLNLHNHKNIGSFFVFCFKL